MIFAFCAIIVCAVPLHSFQYASTRYKGALLTKNAKYKTFFSTKNLESINLCSTKNLESINFEDSEVSCVSEGGRWNRKENSAMNFKGEVTIINIESSSSDTMKFINFEDDEVLCISEGGSTNFQTGKLKYDNAYQNTPNPIKQSATDLKFLQIFTLIAKEVSATVPRLSTYQSDAESIVKLCDELDLLDRDMKYISLFEDVNYLSQHLKKSLLRLRRYALLAEILKRNQNEYIEIVSFLANRIARSEFPNVQNVPYPVKNKGLDNSIANSYGIANGEDPLVDNCILSNTTYKDSPLDMVLLPIFRQLVQEEIGWKSNLKGIEGLLEEGRYVKLSERGAANDSYFQHLFVKNVLTTLMTPIMPPFYRLVLSGMVPYKRTNDPDWLVTAARYLIKKTPDGLLSTERKEQLLSESGRQQLFGTHTFYGPFITSVVTPPFLSFLVGPSHWNFRKDGKLGGMVVEKCKFLQASNCKGLCLHQCKLPAEEFFVETLGMPLTVMPNFETQECQWSFGETPKPYYEDEDFPKGCIVGCETRKKTPFITAI